MHHNTTKHATQACLQTFEGSLNEENSDPDSGIFGMHLGTCQRRGEPQHRLFGPGKQFSQQLQPALRWLARQPLCPRLHTQGWHLCCPSPCNQPGRHQEQQLDNAGEREPLYRQTRNQSRRLRQRRPVHSGGDAPLRPAGICHTDSAALHTRPAGAPMAGGLLQYIGIHAQQRGLRMYAFFATAPLSHVFGRADIITKQLPHRDFPARRLVRVVRLF